MVLGSGLQDKLTLVRGETLCGPIWGVSWGNFGSSRLVSDSLCELVLRDDILGGVFGGARPDRIGFPPSLNINTGLYSYKPHVLDGQGRLW